MNRNIHNLDRYDYELDKKFISSYPLEKRENSKLLVYKDNKIVDSNFKNISNHLPKNSTLFFNDSKVLEKSQQEFWNDARYTTGLSLKQGNNELIHCSVQKLILAENSAHVY